MQENQQVVFLSDGGEDVRNLQFYLNPQAEHLLDWFHVTMRLTVLTQTAKGLSETIGEGEEQQPLRSEVLKALESIKWYLWHGNVFQALRHLQFVEMDLEGAEFESHGETTRKLLKTVEEFSTYINAIAALFRITASVTVTVRESARASWNRQSIKSSVNGS